MLSPTLICVLNMVFFPFTCFPLLDITPFPILALSCALKGKEFKKNSCRRGMNNNKQNKAKQNQTEKQTDKHHLITGIASLNLAICPINGLVIETAAVKKPILLPDVATKQAKTID